MVTAANGHAAAVTNQWNILKPPANTFDVAQQKLATYINGLPDSLFAYGRINGVYYAFKDAPFAMVQETIPDTVPPYNELDGGPRGVAPPLNPATPGFPALFSGTFRREKPPDYSAGRHSLGP